MAVTAATTAPAAPTAPAAAAEGAAPPGSKKALIGGLTFAGLVLGGLVGSLVVAPRIIGRPAPSVADGDSAHGSESHAGAEAPSAEEAGGEHKLVELTNIIVNPAGSEGSRFLMTSVAISVADGNAQKILAERQVELRDRITTILETRTMAQLTAPGERDSLKLKIAVVASAIVGPKVPLKVFLPQFVIQ